MSISFSVFADFHYKYMMYAPALSDLEKIMDKAKAEQSELVLHCGDFCNDYIGSPEIWNRFLKNRENLPVFGIYGNHELETGNNSMAFVTPKLTNRAVVWGTKSQTVENGQIAYYYCDRKDYRFIGLDTNYSFNPTLKKWEHNGTGCFTYRKGNVNGYSLGPVQLIWLEKVIMDAAKQKRHCIVFAHDSFSGVWGSSPDTDAVREIYRKANEQTPQTVILSINGHYHTNHATQIDGIVFLDVNTAINGYWTANDQEHYFDSHTFNVTEYDDEGNPINTHVEFLSKLDMALETWFFTEPLSTQITIDENKIIIDGMKTEWVYGIVPPEIDLKPEISHFEFEF